MPTTPRHPLNACLDWLRADTDRACAALVCATLGIIALAGSATHVLHVGAYPDVGVNGWMVWTVAGSLEVLAAYAAWEMRRRTTTDRLIPAAVLLLAVAFIVLANLAAADPHSWAAHLPWAEAFAVAPPLSFLSVAAIAETRGWRPTRRPRRPPNPRPHQPALPARASAASTRPARTHAHVAAHSRRPDGAAKQRTHPSRSRTTAGQTATDTTTALAAEQTRPVIRPGESRTASIQRWISEGHDRRTMMAAGKTLFDVSDSTMKRELQGIEQPRPEPSSQVRVSAATDTRAGSHR